MVGGACGEVVPGRGGVTGDKRWGDGVLLGTGAAGGVFGIFGVLRWCKGDPPDDAKDDGSSVTLAVATTGGVPFRGVPPPSRELLTSVPFILRCADSPGVGALGPDDEDDGV